ncbi:MAG: hypothetical protein A2Z72_01475 [Omnitrophica bacterium RBG_13_46_9]|nr:MAG: hypothetical protein A2Z72_01475 [Omnitrophica bacterium RBG_13_46_9]
MKISAKITFFLIVIFFLVSLFLGLLAVISMFGSQQDNLNISKNEILETSRELISKTAVIFFRLLDNRIQDNASLSTQDILRIINEVEPSNSGDIVVMEIEKRAFFKGYDSPKISALLDKNTVDHYLAEMILTRNKDFYLDNYEKFHADKTGLITPVIAQFRIYDSYGLIVGYGKVMATTAVRIGFMKKKNAEYFRLYAVFSLFISICAIVVAALLSIRFMKVFLINPLKQIGSVVGEVAKGDLNARIVIKSKDEIGDLAKAFNGMTQDLQKTTTSVANLNREVVERKKAEENLRMAEERYRMQFEGAVDGIFIANAATGILIDCNPAGAKLVGRNKSEIVGQHQKILHPKEAEDLSFSRTFAEHRTGKLGQTLETRIITKNGDIRDVAVTANLMEIGDKKVLQGIFRDITEGKKAEEELKKAYLKLQQAQDQLVQAEKLNAVGQLASGVAHEVKNPLGIILQGVNYLEASAVITAEKNTSEILQIMKNSIKRADTIIRALVDFSKASILDIKPEDINSALDSSLELIQHEFRLDNINVIKKMEKRLPKVLADRVKIEQVFINIYLNAIQAMPHGGTLFIHSYLMQLNKPGNGVGGRDEDRFKLKEEAVIVEIEDTGVGIPKENLKKVFDPFFTTKGPRDGAGLGLSVTRNIIEMHQGLIRIESEEGKGTKITITLKIAAGK